MITRSLMQKRPDVMMRNCVASSTFCWFAYTSFLCAQKCLITQVGQNQADVLQDEEPLETQVPIHPRILVRRNWHIRQLDLIFKRYLAQEPNGKLLVVTFECNVRGRIHGWSPFEGLTLQELRVMLKLSVVACSSTPNDERN